MKKMRGEALKIGADTSKSAGEAAHAMEELAAGGRSVAQIMGGEARAAVALAEAGNYDLASSARTIATTMDVWKDSTLSTTDVVNRLAGAANTSRFGVEDMSMAIAQGGGVAASAGIDFQDFSTAIAATASSFNSGSDAGTSFKTFITALSGNSEKAKGAIQDLGLSFYDAQGAIRPMADIVQELHDKLGPLSQEQQTVALKTIFGNDAYRTAAGLMQMTGAEFEALSRTMGNTNAADIAKQRMGNLSGSLEELRGSLETIGIEMGTKAIPALTGMAEAGVTAVNAFGGLPDSTQNLNPLGATASAGEPGEARRGCGHRDGCGDEGREAECLGYGAGGDRAGGRAGCAVPADYGRRATRPGVRRSAKVGCLQGGYAGLRGACLCGWRRRGQSGCCHEGAGGGAGRTGGCRWAGGA
jgi:TP901 family phage tail tape measure protein